MHAILGTSEARIATHPPTCVALAALDAKVHVTGLAGSVTAFPSSSAAGDNAAARYDLQPDEIVTAVELPARGFAANYTYLKIRDRLLCVRACIRRGCAGLQGTDRRGRLALRFRTNHGAAGR
jgi:xanthine dehydrogenase YagS FAD-binding subunit